MLGDPCAPDGDLCDPQNGCNAQYLCSTVDPTAGGCPISRRAWKQNIDYLEQADIEELAKQLLALKLARYNLTVPGQDDARRLGFILEDAPQLASVDGDHVDLYTYTSMLVAGLQAQQGEIEELRRQIDELRTLCATPTGSDVP